MTVPYALRRFYRTYIYPYDPAGLAFRRTLRTALALVATVALLYPLGSSLIWGALAALMLSRIPPGVPFHQRKILMPILVGAAALLVPAASLVGDGVFWPTVAVVAATMAAFLAGAVSPAHGACSLWILLMMVVAIGRPAGPEEALGRGAAVALGGMLAWAAHYLILPRKNRDVVATCLTLAMGDLEHLMSLIALGFGPRPAPEPDLERTKEQALDSLHRLRRLPGFLGIGALDRDRHLEAVLILGLDLVRAFENLLALRRFQGFAPDSRLMRERRDSLRTYLERALDLLARQKRAATAHGQRVDDGGLIADLEQDLAELRQQRHQDHDHQPREWIALANSLYALLSLTRALTMAEGQRRALDLLYPPDGGGQAEPGGFWARLRAALAQDKAPLRAALQAAAAAGAAMLVFKHFGLETGYWVVLFAVLTIKPDLGSSLAVGKNNLVGALIGAPPAMLWLILVGDTGPAYMASAALGALATMYLMYYTGTRLQSAAATFTVVLLLAGMPGLDWQMGLVRVGEVGLAVVLGCAAAVFLWPNRANRRLRPDLARFLGGAAGFLGQVARAYGSSEPKPDALGDARHDLLATLNQARATVEAAGREPGAERARAADFLELWLVEQRILDLLLTLEAQAAQSPAGGFLEQVRREVDAYAEALVRALDVLEQGLSQDRPSAPPNLAAARDRELRARLGELKERHADAGTPLGELLNLSSYLWTLHGLEEEAVRASDLVDALARP